MRRSRAIVVFAAMCCSVLAALAFSLPAVAGSKQDELEKKLPEKFRKSPYSLMSLSVGHPNDGFQLRAKRLKSSKYVRVRSSARAYGHPALILMLKRTAKQIGRSARGSRLLVGDISAKNGGSLTGHASHQSGRDADVAFYQLDAKGKPIDAKSMVAFDANGKAKDGSGAQFDDYRNWLLVKSWVDDNRAGLSHVFVSTPLRKRLLDFARHDKRFKSYVNKAAVLLKQPANSSAHDDHFHVRISCPKRQEEICKEQSKRRADGDEG
ncbi:MAG: penicillin-insensitive murein endopeptidase [Polyangiaceae bacterium]|nr:penicillin-insensitive murein endopeptidase [Polyangiaceae bacterium]MCB9609332.1 penicillin-insensitive murein endopeptidase [Polyangiaceae bacterium]